MLSTKTEYAIRGLIELALQPDELPVAIRKVCEKQQLPVKYMEQIFGRLKGAGLIKSIKGAGGGYVLQRSPEQISLKEIMDAIADEPVGLNCQGRDGYREYCVGPPCDFFSVWGEIESELANHLSTISLSRFIVNREANK